jgi:hypothetical protein
VTEKQKVVYVPVALPKEAAEQQKLLSILPHVKYEEKGVGGKPTIQFSGVNVQLVNGEGKTASINGEGNLVIGYDENLASHSQTGSHDLVLGEEQTFTSYGGILGGLENVLTGPFASVTGGCCSTASGAYSSVSGGDGNSASFNFASVSGGTSNKATGFAASVSGGKEGVASNSSASVSDGKGNLASGTNAWVGGGLANTASGTSSAIFGGKLLEAKNEYEAIP